MRYVFLFVALTFILSCSNFLLIKEIDPTNEMSSIYEPFIEKGFCLSPSGIYNIQVGGWMSAPMPLCNKSDTVMHTHPIWAEQFANFIDFIVWEEYYKLYGNVLFGVEGKGWVKVYERRK